MIDAGFVYGDLRVGDAVVYTGHLTFSTSFLVVLAVTERSSGGVTIKWLHSGSCRVTAQSYARDERAPSSWIRLPGEGG